jgi:hypothetical protein
LVVSFIPHAPQRGVSEKWIRDKETKSMWEPAIGWATAVPLKGEHLAPLNGIVSCREVRVRFYPKSVMYPTVNK